jgi:hypothetical protein
VGGGGGDLIQWMFGIDSSVLSEHLSIPNTKADFKEVHFRQDSLYQTPSPFKFWQSK